MRAAIPLLCGLGLALFVDGLPPLHNRRLAARVEPYLNGLGGRPSALVKQQDGGTQLRLNLQKAASHLLPLDPAGVRARLDAAGSDQTVESFRLDQVLWAVGVALCGAILALVTASSGAASTMRSVLLMLAVGAGAGWIAVDRRLAVAGSRRRETVRQELPVAIDLLTLSIMAGEAVPQAFARVGELLGGEVGKEFRRVVGSVRGGTPVAEALQELPARLPDVSVGRLVDALCTGIDRGAPLAETLRGQAEDLRRSTSRDLLESGARREILMLLPIVFLILPTIVAFTLLPGLASLDLLVP